MKDPTIEPLPGDLATLLASESRAYANDGELHTRVRRGVDLALGVGSDDGGGDDDTGGGEAGGRDGADGGHTGGASMQGGSAGATAIAAKKAFLVVALGGFVGGVVVGRGTVDRVPASSANASPTASSVNFTNPTSAPEMPAAPATRSEKASDAPSVPVGALPPACTIASPSTSPVAPTPPADARSDLTRERGMVDAARAALAAGKSAEALAFIEEHATTFPRGQLSEERGALRIQALLAAGRRAEAEARAVEFRRAYPRSALWPVLASALDHASP